MNKKAEKYIYGFYALDTDDQLEVAEAVSNELLLNEQSLDDDEYDMEKSRDLRNLFDVLLMNTDNIKQHNNFVDLLEKFKQLSTRNKKEVMKNIKETIEEVSKKDVCEKNGHNFSAWVKYIYSENRQVATDGLNGLNTYLYEYPVWKRTCKRCGYEERSETKPSKVINAKNVINKNSKKKN